MKTLGRYRASTVVDTGEVTLYIGDELICLGPASSRPTANPHTRLFLFLLRRPDQRDVQVTLYPGEVEEITEAAPTITYITTSGTTLFSAV